MKNWKKTFFVILTSQAVSKLTSSVLQFAIVWYINDITKSALYLSMALLVGFLPRALLGSFIGVFIDRYNRKTIMIISDLTVAIVSLLPIVVGLFTSTIPLFVIYIVLFLRSVGTAFHEPASQAITPQIVPKDQLIRSAGISQGIDSVSMIISPAISATLYALWNLNGIIMLDVLGAICAVILLSTVSIPTTNKNKEKFNPYHVITETKEGFLILKSNRGLMSLVVVTAFYSLAMMPISALFPLMCTSFFGGTEFHTGIVETVFAVGLLLGAALLSITGGTKNKIYSIVFSCFLMSLSLFVSGILKVNQFYIFSIASFFMGFSGPFYWGTYRPLLQASFSDEYLGRVLALANSLTVIASPVGMVISGVFSEVFGAKKWFIVSSIMTLTCGLACILNKDIRLADINLKGDTTNELPV